MAPTVDYLTLVISVPQADLTPITGTLFEMDTNVFRLALASIQDSEEGMPFETMFRHNTEVTVAGTTFARTFEIINGYSIEFTPDAQYSVRLAGSNNNIFDVENGILVQNQVQVIAQNSAGLISKTGKPAKGVEFSFSFLLLLFSDHVSPLTGGSPTAQISKDGAALAATTNTPVEVGQGLYRLTLTAAEMNANEVAFVGSEATADNAYITIETGA